MLYGRPGEWDRGGGEGGAQVMAMLSYILHWCGGSGSVGGRDGGRDGGSEGMCGEGLGFGGTGAASVTAASATRTRATVLLMLDRMVGRGLIGGADKGGEVRVCVSGPVGLVCICRCTSSSYKVG